MAGQYWERVYEYVVSSVNRQADLLGRSVLLAKETRTFANGAFVNFCARRYNSRGIELRCNVSVAKWQLFRFNVVKFLEPFGHFFPFAELFVEEIYCSALCGTVLPRSVELLAL